MKMRGKLPLLAIVLLVIPFVTAADTQINVRTWQDHKVSIFVLDTTPPHFTLESWHIYSNTTGEVSATYSGNPSKIMLKIQITKDGELVMTEKFNDEEFPTGSPLYLQVIPGEVLKNYKEKEKKEENKSIENQTQNQTIAENQTAIEIKNITTEAPLVESKEASNETNRTLGVLTGKAISNIKTIVSTKITYYVIIGIVAVFVLLLIIKFGSSYLKKRKLTHPSSSQKIVVHSLNQKVLEKQLTESQNKIKELQSEVNRLKNQERIREMEKRISDEREELDRLKKGF